MSFQNGGPEVQITHDPIAWGCVGYKVPCLRHKASSDEASVPHRLLRDVFFIYQTIGEQVGPTIPWLTLTPTS